MPTAFIVLFVLAFSIGSTPFAFIFVKALKGTDIRTQGSGNVGATNAGRILGKPMGFLILALDALKGVVAAGVMPWLLRLWIGHLAGGVAAAGIYGFPGPRGMGLCFGIGAFLGHCHTPFLRFKGGKGVATALGVYLVVAPMAMLLTLAVCMAIILITRFVSLASITGAVLLPISILFIYWSERPWGVVGVTLAISAAVIYRHRANIRRLLAGQELKS